MENKKASLSLGELIIKIRKEKGYSQRKFAQVSGLSNTTISRIENGETLHPDVETLRLLAVHLDIDEADLIKVVNSSNEYELPIRNVKLNYYKKPMRKIQRYSSVFSTNYQTQESKPDAIPEQFKQLQPPPKQKEVTVDTHIQKVNLKGMRLITLRLEKNITQKELADALGIDKTLISQYEGEIIKPDYETVERLAQYFGVTLEYLCGNVEMKVEAAPPVTEYTKEEPATVASKDINLRPEYISIAEEMQNSGIEPEDIRNFIEMIKRYKKI